LLLAKPLETPAYLNMLHPHADGLVASYLFNERGGKVFDYTRNQNYLSITNATWAANGLQFDASGEYASLDNTNQVVNSQSGTITIYFKSLSAFNDNGARTLFGSYSGAVGVGAFVLVKTAANALMFIMHDGTFHYIRMNSAPVKWQTGFYLTIQWDRQNAIYGGYNMAFNYDGKYITPDTTLNATNWNNYTINTPLGVGNDITATTNHCNGIISEGNFYNKVLPESTLKSLNDNPYSMYYQPSNVFLNLMGAYPGAGKKQDSIYYGANAFPIGRGL